MNSKFNTPNTIKAVIIAIVSLFTFNNANAQAHATVKSTNGYTVIITLDVVRIIAPNSCKWGYNFNTRISYDIQFTGTNIPKNLYTLQTTLACGTYDNFTSLPTKGGKGQRNTHSNPWNPNTDCSTVTPASLNCNTFTTLIEGPGIARQTLTMNITTSLPVNLVSYTALVNPAMVDIKWQTSSESNNSHFIVERSMDAENWTVVGQVEASKEQQSINDYSIGDRNAEEGLNYYRLTQVDVDGKRTVYPNILAVHYESDIKFEVYPNPASAQFTVSGDNIENSEVTVLDATGKVVLIQGELIGSSLTFKTDELENGIYFINVNTGSQLKSYKLTVAK